jgi:nucleoside-diphosphate-sugar epimerase
MKAVKEGTITINGGEQWRPIIAVKDIAGYVTEACREQYEGIYVLSLENVIIRELGEKISNLIPNTKVNYTEISFQDARNYKVDNTKSLKTFKYKPTVTVEDEVARMVKLFEESRVENPEDKVYHNGAFLKNKKENNTFA